MTNKIYDFHLFRSIIRYLLKVNPKKSPAHEAVKPETKKKDESVVVVYVPRKYVVIAEEDIRAGELCIWSDEFRGTVRTYKPWEH